MSPSVSHPPRSATQASPSDLGADLDTDLDAVASDLRFDLDQPLTAVTLERNATALMNSLFTDVDRMLERGGALPVELPVEPEAPESAVASPDPAEAAGLDATLTALLSSQFASLAPKLSPRDLLPSFELAEPLPSEAAVPIPAVPIPAVPPSANRSSLWLATLCGSLLLSLGILSLLYRTQVSGIWLSLLETYRPAPVMQETGAGASVDASVDASAGSAPAAQPSTDGDFLTYLQRSLERLSHHAELPPAPSPVPISPTAIVVPGSSSGSPSSTAPSATDRVYVPIYPTTVSPAPVRISPVPAAPAPQQATQPLSPARPRPQVAAVPNIAAATDQTLIGVLELGERSAALFEVNGIPKRIEIGEQFGSSGWTLVSIRNQEAIVRRNGEVRSIYVGQKF